MEAATNPSKIAALFRTARIYRLLLGVQVRSQLQYRISFLLDSFSAGFGTILSFLTLALVFHKFDDIAGWNLAEIAFLYGMVELAFAFMDMVFSGFDPDFFAPLVRQGALDQLLLRPLDVTLQVFGSRFIIRRLGRSIQGALIFGYALGWAEIHWNAAKLLFLPVVLISQICFFGGLFIIGSTITIWTIERIEAVNIFTYGGTELMTYPMNIYPEWMQRFFTYIVPAMFLNYIPALYFLDKPNPLGFPQATIFLSPIAGFGMLGVALAFWKFGIRHYQSTGT